jgi:hypothetical protein
VNTPPLLVAAALFFWGWQTGHWIVALFSGAVLESSRVIKSRWSLTQTDFNRLWNICFVLFLGLGSFLLINENPISFNDFLVNAGRRPEAIREAGKAILVWYQWLPMIFFPFMLAQTFNEENAVGRATFSWWLRKQEKRDPSVTRPRETVNVTFPYLAVCLLAASATAQRQKFFYIGTAALIAWSLWSVHAKRFALAAQAAAFLAIAVAGYATHTGLYRLQKTLEQMDVAWFSRFSALNDSKVTRTAIGSVGRLKLSNRIVLRLRTDNIGPPERLREASYSIYRAPIWSNRERNFGNVTAEDENTRWKLLPDKHSRRSVNIAQYLRGGAGLLTLPTGCSEITELAAANVQTNFYAATWAGGAPGLVIYNALFDRGATFDSAPTLEDRRAHDESEPALAQVAAELQLRKGMEPREAMNRVENFFAEKFQYSTYLGHEHQATSNETALGHFLLHTRSGHCEYFATATTLLLRMAGVPTRYAIGYSVQEGHGRKYVVRERHAHAWALVWYDNAWHDFDTTPGSWNAVESANASFLQPIRDFFSDLWFQFSKFRWSKTEWRKYIMWAPAPLLVIVIARFLLGKQWKKTRARRADRRLTIVLPGADSDFYLIEKYFAARGLERKLNETWSAWLRRIEDHESRAAQLHRVLMLHQRHRFDPRGLNESERAELHAQVSRWLAGHSA